MIPRTFHFIWVGDESRRPDNCIATWREAHPGWDLRIWGNAERTGRDWVNARHMEAMAQREWNGVADMMRWEILLEHGGIVFDADSICARPLDDALLDCEAFACWESEIARPGLIAAGYFGCTPGNRFVAQIVEDIAASPSVVDEMAWKTVGPLRLTECYRKFAYTPLRIYPSHYFIPRHFTGVTYEGRDPVYAHQLWGSTLQSYDRLHRMSIGSPPAPAASPDPSPALPAAASPAPAAGRAARPVTGAGMAAGLPDAPAPQGPLQRVPVSAELAALDRRQVFAGLLAGQRVLHVGCGGSGGGGGGGDCGGQPGDEPAAALHVALEPHCALLDGVEADDEARARLRPLVRGALLRDMAEVSARYDVVLVSSALEQEADIAGFLARIEAVDASLFLVAASDASQCRDRHFAYEAETGIFTEGAHPDHHHWYTPYTLANTLRRHSGLELQRMWFLEGTSLLALLSRPSLAAAA